MSDKNNPAVEADGVEKSTYELAFHVLPTIAEGEVETVFAAIKDLITKHGEVVAEEAPARFDLAYEIIKYLEGRNRKFTSAYFGWVRFEAFPSEIEAINEEVDGMKELLRHMLIKLTKTEAAHPFYFHEALESTKVETVEVADEAPATEEADAPESEATSEAEAEDGATDEEKV